MLDTTAATKVIRGKVGRGVAPNWINARGMSTDKRTDSCDPSTRDRNRWCPGNLGPWPA